MVAADLVRVLLDVLVVVAAAPAAEAAPACSGPQAALVDVVVPAAVCFPFAMAGLEVVRLVAAAHAVSALSFSWALFPLWSASCCATERTFGFDIPIQEALDCVYAAFAMAGLEGAQLVAAAYVESARSFLLALFCLWSASCRTTRRIEHLLPGSLQCRSHCRRHWRVW